VLLTTFDEAALSLLGGGLSLLLSALRGRWARWPRLQLLAKPLACLGPVIALGVILRPRLPPSLVGNAIPLLHARVAIGYSLVIARTVIGPPQLPHQ
jgi:hypothetical protein